MSIQFDIGILTGSGPEAGIDLWQRVLAHRRQRLGEAFRGDADAPSVLVLSEPRLGASMDLEANAAEMLRVVLEHARELDRRCRRWAIACHTLNLFADELRVLGPGGSLVSYVDAAREHLDALSGSTSVALFGARPVASVGPFSAYVSLADRLDTVPEGVIDDVHALIEEIKRTGATDALRRRWSELHRRVDADLKLLACTELPLVADDDPGMVDVTDLIARRLESPPDA